MAKFGVPMALQTHVEDNQPTGNRFYWHHNRPHAPRASRAHVDPFCGPGGLSFGLLLNQPYQFIRIERRRLAHNAWW